MPTFTANVDVSWDEIIEDIPDHIFEKEYQRRYKRNIVVIENEMSKADINQSLDLSSFELRKIGRCDLAFRIDEIRFDYFT